MNENSDIVNDVWFSGVAHFYLNAEINKKNSRHWGTEKPDYHLEKQLHSKKVTVWAAMSSHGIIGPFFFEDEDGVVETINSVRYLNVLKGKFMPALRRRSIDTSRTWFRSASHSRYCGRLGTEHVWRPIHFVQDN